MLDRQRVIERIRQAFRDTEHPGDAFLQGSHEGCEPDESVAPFMGIADWSQLDAAILDTSYTALSFFSEGGFRYFLPAYLIADLQKRLQTADPVFHLTNRFSDRVVKIPAWQRIYEKGIGKSACVNPQRYGAMTWHDHAASSPSSPKRKPRPSRPTWNIHGTRTPTGSMQKKSMQPSIASGGTGLRRDPRIKQSGASQGSR